MYEQMKHKPVLALPRDGSIRLKVILVFGLMIALLAWPPAMPSAARAPSVDPDYGNLPLSFVANAGQATSAVRFQGHDLGTTMSFTGEEIILALPSKTESSDTFARLRFLGVNSELKLVGEESLPGVVNYFIGDDPAAWRTDIPTYAAIVYRQVYPGIDLRYDGTSGRLKGTYVVAPGASPDLIRWEHEGATDIRIDEASGDLVIAFPGAKLVEHAPVAWQEVNGQRVDVTVNYDLRGDGSVGFEIGSYDPSLPLTIDPTISYSTYLGGSGFEETDGMAVDGAGNAYIVGTTTSAAFPDDPLFDYSGGEDVFVVKVNASGTALLYTTYLGGDGDDSGSGIAVDGDGYAYVTGNTDSGDFPTRNPVQGDCSLYFGVCTGDAFVSKLSSQGTDLVYSTYLGGKKSEEAEGISIDGNRNAYVVGTTFSSDFPTENPMLAALQGLSDAFVAKLNAGGSNLVYSTYLGGGGIDAGAAIAADAAGHAYVTGETTSTDFPTVSAVQETKNGSMDIFAVKLNLDGSSMTYGTYLGGSDSDYAYGIALDGAGHAYLTGQTESGDFPTTPGAYDTTCGSDGACDDDTGFYTFGDAFVVKLSNGGDSLLYSTFLGGSDLDKGYAIAVDEDGYAYVTGDTHSADFPTVNPTQHYGGGADAFVVKLGIEGSALAYSTYLGGDSGDYGTGIALLDASAFVSGITFSEDFPIESPVQSTHGGGDGDAFVVKLEGEAGPPLPDAPNLQSSDKAASKQYVMPEETFTYTITLRNSGTLAALADVSDPMPSETTYVADSATGGGTYDAGTQTLLWDDVEVDPGGETSLSFMVTATTVETPTLVTNVATITYDEQTLQRAAGVLLVPESTSGFDLRGSRKTASQSWIAAGETLTYAVELHNSGNQLATADVTDVVPEVLSYVSGSADSSGGNYNSATRTISWSDVQVPPGDSISLEFAATAPTIVDEPRLVVNTAVINAGDQSFERQAIVLLVPEPVEDDVRPPTVKDLTIDDRDVLTELDVTLYISATDDSEVTEMYVQEWAWSGHPMEPWQVVQSSGWVPYQESFGWTLEPVSGVHFVAVWVADAVGNVSHLNHSALDYASLLLPQETLDQHGFIPYLVHYEAGQAVTATVETVSGDADLYVWFPGRFGLPDEYSINPDMELDQVIFTAPQSGTYMFVVHGHKASTYDLTISPGGGPRAWSLAGAVTSQQPSDEDEASNSKIPSFGTGPIATLDPLADAEAPEMAGWQLRSHKMASEYALVSGEALTYTILLWNAGTTSVTADVTDVVPVEMSYLAGSATGGATYDGGSGTLTWSDVEVDPAEVKPLAFVVTATTVSTPTLVTNRATITTEGSTVEREATVLLWPESSVWDLYLSQKTVSQHVATAGDVLTYTIQLRHVGAVSSTVTVTDGVPSEMSYVAGSATKGGVYDPGTGEVSWSGVEVGPGGAIPLSFEVMVSPVSAPTPVVNTATIAADGGSFVRRAGVVVLSDSAAGLSLHGSRKIASRRSVTSGESLTYTIRLHNSSRLSVAADVTDAVPPEVTYVSGSATGGAAYDPETATLSWRDVTVPPGESVSLSFRVTATTVEKLTPVVNTAVIAAGDQSFERQAVVLLAAEPMEGDITPPVVEELTIDERDVLTDPEVTLHVSASDDVGVTRMYVQEWGLTATPMPHWEVVQSSGWVSYQETSDWTLASESGARFIGVWVADGAGNVSLLSKDAVDFASLLLPGETIDQRRWIPYLVHYEAGEDVTATLETMSGDADLYVWFPDSFGLPDEYGINPDTEFDQVSFTTPEAGTYLFLVYGYQASTYDLSISPEGGHQLAGSAVGRVGGAGVDQLAPVRVATVVANKELDFYTEPVLALSGLDPLADAEAPGRPFVVYLPLVVR